MHEEGSPLKTLMAPRWTEEEGVLNAFAATPEGRLVCAVIESAFADMGIAQRGLKNWWRTRVKNRKSPRGWMTDIFCYTSWIMSDEFRMFSFRWCCHAVAVDPDGLAESIRKAWMDHMARGGYLSPKSRNMKGRAA